MADVLVSCVWFRVRALTWACVLRRERYCLVVGEGVFLPPFFLFAACFWLVFQGRAAHWGLVIVSSFV